MNLSIFTTLEGSAQKALVIIWGDGANKCVSAKDNSTVKTTVPTLISPLCLRGSGRQAGSTVLESSPKGCDMKANDISHAS